MYRQSVVINAEHGIHTRPAALLVKQAKEFSGDILVSCSGKRASAKSLYRLQTLNLTQGSTIEFSAEGPGAEQAIAKLCELVASWQ
ncbi:HPr family phosphocarrier protein [Ferrimonas aestuarii]|uniref:Phosphocarrier protein HPr n=1 Tax=Ferrimonas aestuarii TaxID=2569539 RepID=A0A4V5NWF7_9GAMM|nr:HPr family phosphocarrier protein [Ferrimonas aestuarii]MCK5887086.1 HPr family phosphocarrier protein [Alcanivorax sp.]TKB57312.1 HPr family phosphocarrier protein [Ferrimonas aestuarii]